MVKILSPLAAPVCQSAGLSPEAQELVTPQQTPGQYVSTLEQNGLQQDACKFMVYGMEEKDAVCYATKSAQKAVDPANLADQEAIKAAEAWMRAPKDAAQQAAAQQAAAEAAAKAGYETPGAWAAQAAAWAKTEATVATPAVPGVPSLTAHAAYGAIQLAAASPADRARAVAQMAEAKASAAARQAAGDVPGEAAASLSTLQKAVPAVPAVQVADVGAQASAKVSKAYQPYCDLGKQIANGQATCV